MMDDKKPTATSPAPTATAKPEPTAMKPKDDVKRGGIIGIVSNFVDPPALDPHTSSSISAEWITEGVYDNLLRWDPDTPTGPDRKLVGDLAESWDVSSDGLTYTFNLYKNVKWDHGPDFGCDDVKATLDRGIGKGTDPDFFSPRGGAVLKPIVDEITCPDNDTVVIKALFPNQVMLQSVGTDWQKIINKELIAENKLDEPGNVHGTGAWRLKDYTRGLSWEWEKSPSYRFAPDFPYMDGVKNLILVDISLILAAFITEEIQRGSSIPIPTPEQIETVKNQVGAENLILPPPLTMSAPLTLYLNTTREPWNDINAVKAVHLALDRMEVALKGTGWTPPVGDIPGAHIPALWGGPLAWPAEKVCQVPGLRRVGGDCTDPTSAKDPQDIALAEQFWAKVQGDKQPAGADCITYSASDVINPLQAISQALKRELDIDCPVDSFPGGTFHAKSRAQEHWIGFTLTGSTLVDPGAYMCIVYCPFETGGARNYGFWTSTEFEDLWNQQVKEGDPVKRKDIYFKMQDILYDWDSDNPVSGIALAKNYWHYLVYTCVKNWLPGPTVYEETRFDHVWLEDDCR
jgi:ABC-type transport system substrate-binding protein